MSGKEISTQDRNSAVGVFYGAIAYTIWGLLPIYWKLL